MQLSVIFRNMLPSEELIYLAKRLMRFQRKSTWSDGGIQLCIENVGTASRPCYAIALSVDRAGARTEELDDDPFLAIRNAFARMEYGRPPEPVWWPRVVPKSTWSPTCT